VDKKRKMITLTYLPYHQIEGLSSNQRIKKILGIVKNDRIVLLEGRLKKEEEAALIEETMKAINKKFTGIELATVVPAEYSNFFKRFVMSVFFRERNGVTIVGPASVVKSIKNDPNKIELLTHSAESKKRKAKK
jgi:hypothetical protein